MPPQHVLTELFPFSETQALEPNCERTGRLTKRLAQTVLEAAEPLFKHRLTRGPQFQAQLESAPDRAVQEFGVIAGDDRYRVAGQGVDLHQEGADDAFDFPGLVGVATSLAQGTSKNKTQRRLAICSKTRRRRCDVSPRKLPIIDS